MIFVSKIRDAPEQITASTFIPEESLCDDKEWACFTKILLVVYIDAFEDLTYFSTIFRSRAENNLPYKIILDFSRETFNIKWFEHIATVLPEIYWAQECLIIHNPCDIRATPSLFKSFENNFKLFSFDLFMCEAYYKCILDSHPYDTTPVRDRPPGINLLIGKLKVRFGRFLASYYFYKHRLLNKEILGINAYPEDIENMMKSHPEYLDYDYFDTIKKYLGPADHTKIEITDEGITAITGWPFSPNIYSKSSVSYVADTFDIDKGNYPYFMCEKIYRPIINRHPFVIQSSSGQINTVKSLNFQTFSDLISEDYNDYRKLDFKHVEKTVLAGKELMQKIPTNTELVQEIVNYNFYHLCKLAANECQRLKNTVDKFMLDINTRRC